jgi:cytochrome c oxidase assembly protein subunit 15
VVWSGVLLLTEALLGALLVKGGYVENNASDMRVLVQCVHFTNTMLLMAALTLTWWWLGEREHATRGRAARGIAWLALAATVVVGATGSVAALADTLFPSPSLSAGLAQDFAAGAPLLVRMRWLHPAAAIVGLGCAIWLSLALRSRAARWLLALIAAQFVLGAGGRTAAGTHMDAGAAPARREPVLDCSGGGVLRSYCSSDEWCFGLSLWPSFLVPFTVPW